MRAARALLAAVWAIALLGTPPAFGANDGKESDAPSRSGGAQTTPAELGAKGGEKSDELDAAAGAPAPRKPLRVGHAGSPPFVTGNEEGDGLSVGVCGGSWPIAQDLSYRLIAKASVADAIDDVASGKLDVAVGPISITSERAKRVQFTQPYFQAQIGILSRERSAGVWERTGPFLPTAFAGASLALFLSLAGVGSLIATSEA